jgi:hypothetical protein
MPRRTARAKARFAVAPLYQLKITLKWSNSPIWRRVIVRADMPLSHLHEVIQIVMGWTDSHPHQFVVGSRRERTYYGTRSSEFSDLGPAVNDEDRYVVADLAPRAKRKFIYEYDFGDSWEHEVVLEEVLSADSAFKHPVCIGGANAGPPEDCGGIGRFYNLLEVLSDPNHPDYRDTKEWLGVEFDAAEFDLGRINAELRRVPA